MKSSSQLLWAKVEKESVTQRCAGTSRFQGLKIMFHVWTEKPQESYLTSLHLKTGLIHCLRIAINRTHRILITYYVCVK